MTTDDKVTVHRFVARGGGSLELVATEEPAPAPAPEPAGQRLIESSYAGVPTRITATPVAGATALPPWFNRRTTTTTTRS